MRAEPQPRRGHTLTNDTYAVTQKNTQQQARRAHTATRARIHATRTPPARMHPTKWYTHVHMCIHTTTRGRTFFASASPFACLILDHLEWPAPLAKSTQPRRGKCLRGEKRAGGGQEEATRRDSDTSMSANVFWWDCTQTGTLIRGTRLEWQSPVHAITCF